MDDLETRTKSEDGFFHRLGRAVLYTFFGTPIIYVVLPAFGCNRNNQELGCYWDFPIEYIWLIAAPLFALGFITKITRQPSESSEPQNKSE